MVKSGLQQAFFGTIISLPLKYSSRAAHTLHSTFGLDCKIFVEPDSILETSKCLRIFGFPQSQFSVQFAVVDGSGTQVFEFFYYR